MEYVGIVAIHFDIEEIANEIEKGFDFFNALLNLELIEDYEKLSSQQQLKLKILVYEETVNILKRMEERR